jgi:hypothetical protein
MPEPTPPTATEEEIVRASNAAMASLLNITFLPVISFIWLVIQSKQLKNDRIDHYHTKFAILLSLCAAFFLVVVTALMIIFGGFNSAWTWVYVITYFTLIHSLFIVAGVWAMTRAWSGKRVW